jgi:hypothetical protein
VVRGAEGGAREKEQDQLSKDFELTRRRGIRRERRDCISIGEALRLRRRPRCRKRRFGTCMGVDQRLARAVGSQYRRE